MNNEEKVYSLLEKLYLELQTTKTELKDEIRGVRTELKDEIQENRKSINKNTESIGKLEYKVDKVNDKLDNIEANNADRHLGISKEIEEMKDNFNNVEQITAKNWQDIARLKSIR